MIDLLSYSKRPIKVLFPSSTLPAVIKRNMSIGIRSDRLKISALFSVLHRRFRDSIVDAGFPALAGLRRNDFNDAIVDHGGVGLHSSRARHIAHGTVADSFLWNFVAPLHFDNLSDPHQLDVMR